MQPNEAVIYFAKFIEKELGIIYSDFNYFQLHSRLEEIAKMYQLKDVEELLQIARRSLPADLKQLILDVATNNETSFFRDPKMFQMIKSYILPEFGNKRIKIWSAACSSGQEPYSLAMLLMEYAETSKIGLEFDITATDISSRVLDRAKKGRFSQLEVQRGLPTNLLIKYFEKDNTDYWTFRSDGRVKMNFQKVNLLDSFDHLGEFDLILCRNVLIYQNVENKKRIIEKIYRRMTDRSYLILGAGESMIGLSESFESKTLGEALTYRAKGRLKVAA